MLTFFQQIAKHLRHFALGFIGVGMRTFPITAQNRTVFHIFLTQIAMRIAGHRDWQIRADQLADGQQDMMIARTDFLYFTGAVQMQINTVQLMEMLADSIQKQRFNIIKGGTAV